MTISHKVDLFGYIDSISNWKISGWIIDKSNNIEPIIKLMVDGAEVARCKPTVKRADICLLYGTDKRTGFVFDIKRNSLVHGAKSIAIVETETGFKLPFVENLADKDAIFIDSHDDYRNEVIRNGKILQALEPSRNILIQLNNNPEIRLNIDPGIGNIHIYNGIKNTASEHFRSYALAQCLRTLGFTPLVFAIEDLPFINTSHLIAVFFVRCSADDGVLAVIKRLKQEGVKVFSDFDDLVFRPSLMHKIDGVRFLTEHEKEAYRRGMLGYRLMIANSDAVVVSTTYLAKQVREINPHVFILNNFPLKVARDAAAAIASSSQKYNNFTIGYYSGTLTHQADFQSCAQALELAMRQHSNVRLRIVGAFDLAEFPNFNDLLPRIDQVPLMSYGRMIADIAEHVDLVIAPLEVGNEFCESKSELKFFDAALSGTPILASATEVFAQAITHKKTGLLAKDASEWIEALSYAILNKAQLRVIGNNARSFVNKEYSVAKQVEMVQALLDANKISVIQRLEVKLPSVPPKTTSVKASTGKETLAILLPDLMIGSGGHRKAMTFCSEYQRRGGKVEVIFISNRDRRELEDLVHRYYFPNLENVRPYNNQPPEADVVVATSWPTAYEVAEWESSRRKYYFVQDFEPMFNPMSTQYVKAYHSYRLGLEIITFGRWNQSYIERTFGISSTSIDFPIDSEMYFVDPSIKRSKRILFYARPSQPRRLYELGIEALLKIRPYIGDWDITLFGEELQSVPQCFSSLGKITDLNELRRAYSEASIGLAFSSTNPSLIPFEMLACGLPVVDIDLGYSNADFAGCKGIEWSLPTSAHIVKTLYDLIATPHKLTTMSKFALEWAKNRPSDTDFAVSVLKALKLVK